MSQLVGSAGAGERRRSAFASERASRAAIAVALVVFVYLAGALLPVGRSVAPDVALTVGCGFVLALAITVVAAWLSLSRAMLFRVCFALLFLNLAAVAVEGTLFAPAVAPPSLLVANLVRLVIASALIAGVTAALLGSRRDVRESACIVHGWWWRLLATAGVYLVLYLVIGGINYSLVTHPYYESHGGSLTVPPAGIIFLYEPVRGLLIALSVWPLITVLRGRTLVAGIVAGSLLFVVGGLTALLPEISLPLYLRVASLWEIFGQNFLTGLAAAYLLSAAPRRGRWGRKASRPSSSLSEIRVR